MATYVWVFVFSHRSKGLDTLLQDPKTKGVPGDKPFPPVPPQPPANLDIRSKIDPPDRYVWVSPRHKEADDAQEYLRSGGGKDLLEQPEFQSSWLFEIE